MDAKQDDKDLILILKKKKKKVWKMRKGMILPFLRTTGSMLNELTKLPTFISIIKNYFGNSSQCKRRKNTGKNT